MQASNDWPSAPGVITVSQVDSMLIKRKAKAKISYRFTVGGGSYVGSRVRFADTTGSNRSSQEALIAPYPVGANVKVYYDPKNPKVSVLEPGGGIRGFGLIIPPLLLVVIGGFFVAAGLQQQKAKKMAKKKGKRRPHRSARPVRR